LSGPDMYTWLRRRGYPVILLKTERGAPLDFTVKPFSLQAEYSESLAGNPTVRARDSDESFFIVNLALMAISIESTTEAGTGPTIISTSALIIAMLKEPLTRAYVGSCVSVLRCDNDLTHDFNIGLHV